MKRSRDADDDGAAGRGVRGPKPPSALATLFATLTGGGGGTANEASAESAPDPKALAVARHPELAAAAADVVSLVVGDGAPFRPDFTHQQFEGEVVWGYTRPRVLLAYTDPDLRFAGAFAADAVSALAATDDAPPPDNIAACLRLAVPDGAVVAGTERCQPRPAAAAGAAAAAGTAEAAAAVADGGAAADAPPAPPSLPPFFPPADAADVVGLGPLPPGARVAAYRAAASRGGGTGGGGGDFVIHSWALDSPALRAYHDRMSTLGAWAIETASPIDAHDPRWRVLGLYELAGGGAPRFAGYATVYVFTNPMRRSRPTSLRLAQLLVLPRYRRAGHGLRLLEAVHAAAAAADAFEVTVEAPCEGMRRLRDARDVGAAARGRVFAGLGGGWGALLSSGGGGGGGGDGGGPPPACAALPPAFPTAEDLEAARLALRCTGAQARRAFEALVLARLPYRGGGGGGGEPPPDAAVAALYTAFRVAVKRRIFATDAEVRDVTDADARKAALEQLFRDARAEYAAALGACGLMARAEAAAAVRERAAEVEAAEAEAEGV